MWIPTPINIPDAKYYRTVINLARFKYIGVFEIPRSFHSKMFLYYTVADDKAMTVQIGTVYTKH